jgi:hypothetical protein
MAAPISRNCVNRKRLRGSRRGALTSPRRLESDPASASARLTGFSRLRCRSSRPSGFEGSSPGDAATELNYLPDWNQPHEPKVALYSPAVRVPGMRGEDMRRRNPRSRILWMLACLPPLLTMSIWAASYLAEPTWVPLPRGWRVIAWQGTLRLHIPKPLPGTTVTGSWPAAAEVYGPVYKSIVWKRYGLVLVQHNPYLDCELGPIELQDPVPIYLIDTPRERAAIISACPRMHNGAYFLIRSRRRFPALDAAACHPDMAYVRSQKTVPGSASLPARPLRLRLLPHRQHLRPLPRMRHECMSRSQSELAPL